LKNNDKTTTKYRTFGVAAIVAILSVSLVAIALSQSAVAAPANKSAFGGEGVGAIAPDGAWHSIVNGTIKTSTPSDLLVTHNQECTIHTGLNLDKTNQDLTSAIREDVRLLVLTEGQPDRYINPVPLYPEGQTYAAVTMCGQAYHIETNILLSIFKLCAFTEGLGLGNVCTEDDPIFNSYIRTKAAHGWSWVVPNLGQGEHTIVVQAQLYKELDAVGDGSGKKGPAKDTSKDVDCTNEAGNDCVDTILEIGKRSLIITEEKFSSSI